VLDIVDDENLEEELSSAKEEREIIELLYYKGQLKPEEISNWLTSKAYYDKFVDNLDFYLNLLCRQDLMERKSIETILTNLTDKRGKFYEMTPNDGTLESVAHFLTEFVTPYRKTGVSEDVVYKSILDLLSQQIILSEQSQKSNQ